MKIVPLTEERLKEAIGLANKVFPPEKEEEPAKEELTASLFPGELQNFFSRTKIQPGLKYWVAVNSKGKVAGVVGLYNYESDAEDTIWLGWFFVAPRTRRKGIGTELLNFAISEAQKRGKKVLKLYSTTDPEEFCAHRLYGKNGFLLVLQEPWNMDPKLKKLFFELNLKARIE